MSHQHFKIFFLFASAVILTLGLSISFQSLLAAWTAPLANPSICISGNPGCDAPLNAGPLSQSKLGALRIVNQNYPASPYGLIVEKGKVGIGTTNPGAKLELSASGVNAANLRLTNTYSGGKAWELQTGISGVSDAYFGIKNITDNLQTLVITNTGKVGIGTASPRAKLDVGDTTADTLKSVLARHIEGDTTGEGTYLGVKTYTTQPINVKSFAIEHKFYGYLNSAINFYRGSSYTGGWIRFATNNGTEQVTIDNAGKVGIGTTNPGAKLEVAGQVKITGGFPAAGRVLTSDAVGLASWQTPASFVEADTWQTVTTRGNSTTAGLVINGQTLDHQTDNFFYLNSFDGLQLRINSNGGISNFQINNSANSTVLIVTNDGRIGIGTTNPGTYGYGALSYPAKADIDGYVAADDIWIKDMGATGFNGWVAPALGPLRLGAPGCGGIITTASTCWTIAVKVCSGSTSSAKYFNCAATSSTLSYPMQCNTLPWPPIAGGTFYQIDQSCPTSPPEPPSEPPEEECGGCHVVGGRLFCWQCP